MAELVDASDSKSGFRKKVQVRFLFWALRTDVLKRRFFHLKPRWKPISLFKIVQNCLGLFKIV